MAAQYVIVVSPIRLLADGIASQLREWGFVALTFIPGTKWDIATMGIRMRTAVLVVDGSSKALDAAHILIKAHAFAGIVILNQAKLDYLRSPLASLVTLGLLDAKADITELVAAIDYAARGLPYLARRLEGSSLPKPKQSARLLTPRETQVADLLARQLSYRAICSALSLRPGTLKSHVRRIYQKLGTRTRDELTQFQIAAAYTVDPGRP